MQLRRLPPRPRHASRVPRTRLLLRLLFALVVLLPAAGIAASSATFTGTAQATGNQFAADTLQPPTGVTAASSNGSIVLAWTATPSAYADGYYVYRSGSSSGPWTQAATITGAATTTWTDTSPAAGTNYYVLRAYRYNWTSGQTTVSQATATVSISDTFSGTGALGVTETGGYTWLFPNSASWSRNGSGLAATTTTVTSNPMAVVETGTPNVDITIPVTGGGEAIYLRVKDATDWLRLRSKTTKTTTNTSTYNGQVCRTDTPPGYTTYVGNQEYVATSTTCSGGGYMCDWYTLSSTTSYSYSAILDQDVAGTVTTLATYSTSSPTSLRVTASGDTITTYLNGSATASGSVTTSVCDTATQHGIGMGPSDVTASGVNNFTLQGI